MGEGDGGGGRGAGEGGVGAGVSGINEKLQHSNQRSNLNCQNHCSHLP